jgi:hypothetical protein
MSTIFSVRAHLRICSVISVAALVSLIGAADAQADSRIAVLSANVGGGGSTPLYESVLGVPGDGMWNLPAADMKGGYAYSSDFFSTSFKINPYTSDPGTLHWAGNPLVSDNSDFSDPANGLAIGVLGPTMSGSPEDGYNFSLTGKLYDSMYNLIVGEVLLFEGTTSGFTFRETGDNNNNMETGGPIVITPTGGWLYDQGYLYDAYEMALHAVPCTQMGGPVQDFDSDIMLGDSIQFNMYAVPEPASIGLLSLAAVFVLRRRR